MDLGYLGYHGNQFSQHVFMFCTQNSFLKQTPSLFMLKFSIQLNTALTEWKATHATPPTSPKIQKIERKGWPFTPASLFSVLSHPAFHLVPRLVSHLFLYSSRQSTSSLFFSVFPFGFFETLRQVGLGLGYLIRLLWNIWWVKCRGNGVELDGALHVTLKKGQNSHLCSVADSIDSV